MSSELQIIRTNKGTHGSYRMMIPEADKDAELTWRDAKQDVRHNAEHGAEKTRIADHTFVPPAARGKGIAMELVKALVADAKSEGFTIVPQCSYVAAAFRRHPEWADLLAEN